MSMDAQSLEMVQRNSDNIPDLNETLSKNRTRTKIILLIGLGSCLTFSTVRDGLGLKFLLNPLDQSSILVEKWCHAAFLVVMLTCIGFFGDAVRRIHIS